MRTSRLLYCILGFILLSCAEQSQNPQLFIARTPESTGVDFTNALEYTENLNPYTFKNFYNGGGVGIGDFNNDGLADIFFCGNLVSNKLYLNEGNLKFKDITASANLERPKDWNTGVSLIDINADGYLDIYVCKSGPPEGDTRYNELFINNGDLTFTEQAKQYGLDNVGLSVHATFFDFDKDGDLDCYLLNNAIKSIGNFSLAQDKRLEADSLGANKLYRNDEGYFTDITAESGIYSSEIGFGLGATVGDINNDGWPDIYISNDFFEKDYLYINQQDGTFKDQLELYVNEISMGSMGADLADINNDGWPEYFVTEMLPERRDRLVTKTFFESWQEQKNAQSKGYFNQFGRNVLQLNNGNGTFSEIGRYAGVEATDWSWASLIFDMDNDGWKDIFVSNGIYKDLLDLDYLNFMSDTRRVRELIQSNNNSVKLIIDKMPSEALPNYFFHNNGNLTFDNKAEDWGVNQPTFSNGSAYGDLDNDGDLDLVVNNINMPSVIYENKAKQVYDNHHHLSLSLKGSQQNRGAIGAKVYLYDEHKVLFQEVNPMRGFESTVDHKLLFGLGPTERLDSILIIWPSDKTTRLYDVSVNQLLTLSEAEAHAELPPTDETIRTILSDYENASLRFHHQENAYVDFQRDRLLYHMSSTEGPCMCSGDVNNDGKEDVYIGGAHEQSGRLFIQSDDESFLSDSTQFSSYRQSEDLDCAFFDANGDGNLDLYLASGGSEFGSISVWLNDALLFGDGEGNFKPSNQKLPLKGLESTSAVVPFDFDKDGDMDLFVGGRSVPFYYGLPSDSYLLVNDGQGTYQPADFESAQLLKQLGMVTDAVAADLNGDDSKELVVVGKWMPVKIYGFEKNKISDLSDQWFTKDTHGWYNTVKAGDFNRDGNMDIIVGNHGLNTRFHASEDDPIQLLINDFDNNGTAEQVISMSFDGEYYPFVQLKELATQLPSVAQRYRSFDEYKNETTQMLFDEALLRKSRVLKTVNLATGILYNRGQKLEFTPLPMHAQLAPVYAIHSKDFDGDGALDLMLAGNFSQSKPEVGTYQGSYGVLMLGDNNGNFQFVPNQVSGYTTTGDVRDIIVVKVGNKSIMITARNNSNLILNEITENYE